MKKIISLLLALMLTMTAASAMADTLVVATNPEFPPFEYVEGDAIVGLDMDIAAEIAKDLGWELQIESMEFGAIVAAVATGKANVAITGMTINDERKLSVDFSEPYYNAKQACIVNVKGTVLDAETLKDKIIGVQLGTTGDSTAETYTATDNVQRFAKALDAVLELAGNKIDAVIIDKPVAESLLKSLNDPDLKILDNIEFADEFFGIAVTKGNEDLVASINKTLARINEDGTMDAILAKYFGDDNAAEEDKAAE